MAVVSTLVFYKSIAAQGDVCGSSHDALFGNNGEYSPYIEVPADAGDLDDQYIVWYDDGDYLPSNLTVSQLVNNNVPIYVDQSLEYLANSGFFASSLFDGTQLNNVVYAEWNGTIWESTEMCASTIIEEITVNRILVYFSNTDSDLQDGEYCKTKDLTFLYYDYPTPFPTLEALIYHKQHVDPSLVIMQAIDGCNAPIITDLNDPSQLSLLSPIGNTYYGESLDYFYLHLNDDWYHAASSNLDYQDIDIVPDSDPGTTQQSALDADWNPFYCEDFTLTSIELYYAATNLQYCESPEIETYYYFTGSGELTFDQLVNLNIPIFTSPQAAVNNHYCQNILDDLAPSGSYGVNTTIFSTWVNPDLKWVGNGRCVGIGTQTVRSIDITVPRCGELIQAVSLCYYPIDVITVYYLASVELNLLQIVQNNIYLYRDPASASNSNYNNIIEYAAIKPGPLDVSIPADQYIIWSGSYYLAKTSGDLEVQSPNTNITQGYECPLIAPIDPIEPELISSGGRSVFYAFLSCGPTSMVQDPNLPGNIFPIYLVNTSHPVGNSNYMSDLVDYMKDNNLVLFSSGNGCNCVKYAHQVEADDVVDALQQLETYYGNVQVVNPQDLGIISLGSVVLYDNCTDCQNNQQGVVYDFPFIDQLDDVITGPNMDIEKNYKLDNVSRPLLRTNPKLSTNVKIVVDESDRIYLESIDANRNLANSGYKKWELDKNSKYSFDLSRYWNTNKTPLDSTYDVLREYSDTSVLDSYNKQFEEEYHYGTRLNGSKLYGEYFRIFAPIWIDFNIPKKFVIYRIDNPLSKINVGDAAADKRERILQLTKNSTIVKVFDLSTDSAIGTYLHNHVYDEFFPKSPLTITMEKDEKSSYNGIDLIKGGFVEKSEYIYDDFVKQDNTLIDTNDFITDGFRRNKVASANLINLEFLFSDPNAKDYSINRYFGLYVDDIDSGIGEVSYVKNGIIKFKSIESFLEGNDPTYAIPEYKLIQEVGLLGYVKLLDSFYNIDALNIYDAKKYMISVKAEDSDISSRLGIFEKNTTVPLKYNQNAGADYIKLNIVSNPQHGDFFKVTPVKKESVRFKIIKNVNGESVIISDDFSNQIQFDTGVDYGETWSNLSSTWIAIEQHIADSNNPLPPNNNASAVSFYNRYNLSIEATNQIDSIVLTERKSSLVDNALSVSTNLTIISVDEIYTNVDPTSGLFVCDNNLAPKRFSSGFFSGNGNMSDIAYTIANSIRTHTVFDAFSVGNSVYIKNYANGYRLMNATLLVGINNNSNFLNIDNADNKNELNLSNDILSLFSAYFFSGGHSAEKSIYIATNTVNQIKSGDFIPTKYYNKYNQVLDIVENIDSVDGVYSKLILLDKSDLKNGEYKVYSKNKLRIGLFSAYDIYDMNFDFYDTLNSKLKELELETSKNIDYLPYKNSTINDQLKPEDMFDIDAWEAEPINYFSNLLPILRDEDPEKFKVNPIFSEYDRLKENYQKEFAVNSRVVPYINKWVLKDTVTVREQPYYLNTNEAFGRTNFAPDITKEGRNREGFTHEWFYIDQFPTYYKNKLIKQDQINSYQDMYNTSFSYINHIEGFEIDRSLFTSVQYDYFDRFMITEGYETIVPIDLTANGVADINPIYWSKTSIQKKYTLVGDGDETTFASTFFKGLKYTFKSRKKGQFTDVNEFVKNSNFNGYRFSVLLKTKTNSSSNSVDYEFIKNDKFKFIILLITLNIDDSFVNYINRKYLYELKHKIVQSIDTATGLPVYKYADVKIDGALNVSSINPNNIGPYIINGIPHNNGTFPRFDQQISIGINNTYGRIKIDYGYAEQYYVDIIKVLDTETIQIGSLPYYIDGITQQKVFLNINFVPINVQKSATYIYEGGGVNTYELLLSNLSASNFIEKIRSISDNVKFTTINNNGTSLSNEYSVEVDDGNEIIKSSRLDISTDDDRPRSYKLKKEIIGYVIEDGSSYYPFLIRHNGRYTVDLRPVVTFTDIYNFNKVIRNQTEFDKNIKLLKEKWYKINVSDQYEIKKSLAYYKKFNRLGVAFNVGFISDDGEHDSDWGMIKNHFYHKINEINPNGVTKLSDTTEYPPLYPLVNEIAIDRRDVNVFRSSWEDNYYIRSRAGGLSDFIPGTMSTVEERSYLGSTVVKFKPSYLIFQFTSINVNTEAELDEILRSSNSTTNAVLFEDNNKILIDFYLDGLIANLIGEDGLKNTINKFVVPSKSEGNKDTVDDDVILYALNNMLSLYTIDDIQLYVREYKGTSSELVSVNSFDLIDNGYERDRTFTYKMHGKKPLNFRLIYNKKLGYSCSIRALIKIQA
jgi:hypothetical protein